MAAGDITPSAPRQDTGLIRKALHLYVEPSGGNFAVIDFVDGLGQRLQVVIRNGQSSGFSYATGATTTVSTPTGFTDLLSDLTITNAKVTASIQRLVTSGLISVTGSVG